MFTPATNTAVNTLPRPDAYVVYGWQRSYFTHKLMAALRFYGADWSFREKTRDNADEVRLRADTHQIPVLHTPENWMIADTTPLLHLLDGRFPNRRLFPAGPLGLLVQIVEEYFDEWIARTTVHWRWNYPENHDLLALDAAHGDADIARSIGCHGIRVEQPAAIAPALREALSSGRPAFTETVFWHHGLLTDEQGGKLSKSQGAASLQAWRERGRSPEELFRQAAEWLRLPPLGNLSELLAAYSGRTT